VDAIAVGLHPLIDIPECGVVDVFKDVVLSSDDVASPLCVCRMTWQLLRRCESGVDLRPMDVRHGDVPPCGPGGPRRRDVCARVSDGLVTPWCVCFRGPSSKVGVLDVWGLLGRSGVCLRATWDAALDAWSAGLCEKGVGGHCGWRGSPWALGGREMPRAFPSTPQPGGKRVRTPRRSRVARSVSCHALSLCVRDA